MLYLLSFAEGNPYDLHETQIGLYEGADELDFSALRKEFSDKMRLFDGRWPDYVRDDYLKQTAYMHQQLGEEAPLFKSSNSYERLALTDVFAAWLVRRGLLKALDYRTESVGYEHSLTTD
jgi:hypothetical protein